MGAPISDHRRSTARRRLLPGAVAVAALALAAVVPTAAAAAPSPTGATASGSARACPGPSGPGEALCHAVTLDNPSSWQGQHASGRGGRSPGPGTATPSGYGPGDLQSAYGLATASVANGAGKTVAIVDAYDDPTVAADVAAYRAAYGLPALCAYGAAGCAGPYFREAYGSGTVPQKNTSWGEEISLDVDMVSAICPNCNVLLVEAASNSYANLAQAERVAASLGPVAISNSYGGTDSSSDQTYDNSSNFDFVDISKTIAVTASSGDNGYGVEYPAASQYVTAVGGTSLSRSGSGWSESVWSGAGSGCSRYEPNPGWQPVTSLCSTRTVADISAVANPNTGVAVYDTDGEPGWMVFGGTSVASPIVASVYALAGALSPSAFYGDTSLYSVTSGTNSRRCSTYLCNAADSLGGPLGISFSGSAAHWYNGPTGNGTPRGTAGF